MKILITGGAGFVASYLAKYCLKNGDEVITSVRWNEDLSRLESFKDKVKIEYVELTDLSSVIRCINKHRPDVISHLAAQSWVPYSFDNPIFTMKNNIESTQNVMEAVRIIQMIDGKNLNAGTDVLKYELNLNNDSKYNPYIHICSSSEFYGKVERKDLPITEDHPANPGNPYGVSKAGGDFLSQLYKEYYDMNIVITRMFTHTGVGRTMMSAENYYAKEVARCEKEGDTFIKISDEKGMNSIRTWADVRDAVKNYYNLFQSGKTGVFNIAGETTKSIRDVLEYLIEISDLDYDKMTFVYEPSFARKVDVDKQVVDIERFKNSIEWSNDVSFEELMESLLDYWRKKT